MKLLIIPSGGIGLDGITMSIMNYYRLFNREEISTTFIATKIKCEKVYYKSFCREIKNNGDSIVELDRKKNTIIYFISLLKLMRKNNYDIVHVHGSSSLLAIELLAAKISGIKARIVHSHNTTCSHKFLHRIFMPLLNNLPTCRLACGYDAGKWLFREKEFIILKNGIEVEKFIYNKFLRENIRDELNISRKKVIGHVGSFNEQKNHTFLIDIFNELIKYDEDYMLILIGDGENRSCIQNKVELLGIEEKVMLLGRRDDIPNLLQAMDIMVLPSIYEGLPLVAIEWQAMGLPVFISDSVTSEVKLTDLMTFISLDSKVSEWANIINSSINYNRYSRINEIMESGYDINTNYTELINLYRSLIS